MAEMKLPRRVLSPRGYRLPPPAISQRGTTGTGQNIGHWRLAMKAEEAVDLVSYPSVSYPRGAPEGVQGNPRGSAQETNLCLRPVNMIS